MCVVKKKSLLFFKIKIISQKILTRQKQQMPIEILMPALSPTMKEGNLAKWVKKEGDKIKSGEVIAEIETDKATMEVEAVDEGILGKILIQEGTENVAVNACIALILNEGEDKKSLETYVSKTVAPAKIEEKKERSKSCCTCY